MPGGGHHVLVVEDDEDMSEIVQSTLERAGYEVVAVNSGADALAYLARVQGRCLVLLDLHMVDMNGWEVLSTLRGANHRQHQVVLMTGAADHQVPRGTPLLRKPFTTDELLGVVRSHARN